MGGGVCVCKKDQPENTTMKWLCAFPSGQEEMLAFNYQTEWDHWDTAAQDGA